MASGHERKQTLSRSHRLWKIFVFCVKRFVTFLVSQVGLTSAVVAYCMLGSVIFKNLEAPYEQAQRLKIMQLREEQTKRFLEISEQMDLTPQGQEKWTLKAEEILQAFQDEVYAMSKRNVWDGQDMDEELQWSYAGAMLYSVTVLTTIGYGHIAPKTDWGRIVTIFYALFGIPLTFLCVRNIGSLLSSCVRFFYRHACIGAINQWVEIQTKMRVSRNLERLQKAIHARARKISLTLTNDLYPYRRRGPISRPSLEEVESVCSKSDGERDGESVEEDDGVVSLLSERTGKIRISSDYKLRVPISLTLTIMTCYIVGGAIMFSIWEKKWNFLVSSYFCVITLTTIGFGDYVPGTDMDSWSNEEKRVICCLYLLFGMAMQAMCFHLMQEEIRMKCRRLARRLGLIEDEQPKTEDGTQIEDIE